MDILSIIGGIVSIVTIWNIITTIKARKKSDKLAEKNATYDEEIKKNQIALQRMEIEAAKKDEVLNTNLDNKFKIQLENIKEVQTTLLDVINSQAEDIRKIAEKQELLHSELMSHKNESVPFNAFVQIFNYSKRIGCDGWVPKEEFEEKYKLILENWFDKIKDLVYQYYDNKTKPGISIIQYDVESDMLSKIDSFYSLSEAIIDDVIARESFRAFIETKKRLHSISEALSLTLKKNGSPYDVLNQKIGTYLIDFSTIYQKAVGEWLKLQKKYYAAISK